MTLAAVCDRATPDAEHGVDGLIGSFIGRKTKDTEAKSGSQEQRDDRDHHFRRNIVEEVGEAKSEQVVRQYPASTTQAVNPPGSALWTERMDTPIQYRPNGRNIE